MDVTKQHLAHIEAIEKLSARWARYLTANIDKTIAPNDDMFVAGELDHYLFVGVSALQVVSEAMLLAPKTELPKYWICLAGSEEPPATSLSSFLILIFL